VEQRVDFLSQLAAHAFDPGDLLDAGVDDAGQAAEMLEQGRAALGADAGDVFEPARVAGLLALLAMARDREAVRLVAHALDQVQRGRFGARPQGFAAGTEDQRLVPRPALDAFGHADDEHLRDSEIGEHVECLSHLALATVDQENVGKIQFLPLSPGRSIRGRGLCGAASKTPLQRLPHRRVVVTRLDAGDVVTAVLRLDRPFRPVDDAGRHCRLAHRVADIETFQTLRHFVETKQIAQRFEAFALRLVARQARGQRAFRVLRRQFEETRAFGADAVLDRDLMPRPLGERLRQQFGVGQRLFNEQFARHRLVDVVLGDERSQHVGNFGIMRQLREKIT